MARPPHRPADCYDGKRSHGRRAELIPITDGNMRSFGHVHHTAATARALENLALVAMVDCIGPESPVFAGGSRERLTP